METCIFAADQVLNKPEHLFAMSLLTGLCYFIVYKIVNSIFFECKNLVYILTGLAGFLMAIIFNYILYSLLSVYCV